MTGATCAMCMSGVHWKEGRVACDSCDLPTDCCLCEPKEIPAESDQLALNPGQPALNPGPPAPKRRPRPLRAVRSGQTPSKSKPRRKPPPKR